MITSEEKTTIGFSLAGKVSGRIAVSALATLRAEKPKANGIDGFNDFKAALAAKSASVEFLQNTGLDTALPPREALAKWIGFAEANDLQVDPAGTYGFMLEGMDSDYLTDDQVIELAKATKVDVEEVRRRNTEEVRENIAKFQEDALAAMDVIAETQPDWDDEGLPVKDLILDACTSTRTAVGKRRGKFADRMADLAIVTAIEDRF